MIFNEILNTVFDSLDLNEKDFSSFDISFTERKVEEMVSEIKAEAYQEGYKDGSEESVDEYNL